MVVISHAELSKRTAATAVSLLTAATTSQINTNRTPCPTLIGCKEFTNTVASLVSESRFNGEMAVVKFDTVT